MSRFTLLPWNYFLLCGIMGRALPAVTLTCTQTLACAPACTQGISSLPCALCKLRRAFYVQHKMRTITKWKSWLEVEVQGASC